MTDDVCLSHYRNMTSSAIRKKLFVAFKKSGADYGLIAKVLGVDRSGAWRKLNGRTGMSTDELVLVAGVLGMAVDVRLRA